MIYLGRFAENFSTLISSGLPVIQSLEITADIINNVHYKEAILRGKDDLGKGQMISAALKRFPDLFPSVFVQMTLIGEKTGHLDSVLMNLVDFYQKEIDRTIDNLVSVLEPALIVFLGFVVGGIMISVLMPLYQIMSF
jgi:type IV pilus assembly protein PilC